MRTDRMFAVVSDDGEYGFKFGYDNAVEEAEILDEKFTDQDFTIYLVGRPITEIPEPEAIEL